MTTWYRTAGNVGDTITPKVLGVASLSSVTAISAKVQLASDSTAAETTLTATVLSATDCTVTVQLGSWLQNLTTAGTYRVWLLITFSGGVGPLAWPARMDDRIVVTVA